MATNPSQPQGALHVTDSRTGRAYELPIVDGAIRAIDLRQIKVSDDDFGLLAYDPGFMNTANWRVKFMTSVRGTFFFVISNLRTLCRVLTSRGWSPRSSSAM